MKIKELVFKINDLTIRIKEDFVRIDTTSDSGLEADDYHLDFENAKDARELCVLKDNTEARDAKIKPILEELRDWFAFRAERETENKDRLEASVYDGGAKKCDKALLLLGGS